MSLTHEPDLLDEYQGCALLTVTLPRNLTAGEPGHQASSHVPDEAARDSTTQQRFAGSRQF